MIIGTKRRCFKGWGGVGGVWGMGGDVYSVDDVTKN